MLIDELVEAYLQQIIFDGFAHADPHPGNVHLTKDRKNCFDGFRNGGEIQSEFAGTNLEIAHRY